MTAGRLLTFIDGDSFLLVDSAWHAWLKRAAFIRKGNSSDAYALNSAGGVRRFGVLVNVARPAAGGNFVVIDASCDWRDRLIRSTVLTADASASEVVFPGANDDDKRFVSPTSSVHFLWWSGPGVALPQAAATGRSMRQTALNGGLVVRSSDGVLCWEKFATDADSLSSVMVFVEATSRMGVSTTPPVYTDPAGADTIPMVPRELNELQDGGMLSQLRGNSPMADDLGLPPVPRFSVAMALGPQLRGPPPLVPVLSLRKYKDGREVEETYEARQVVGAVGTTRRWVKTGLLAASASLVLDSTIDWRDRMLTATVALASVEVAPVAAGFGSGAINGACYTGSGEDPTVTVGTPHWRARVQAAQNLTIMARNTDGALCVRNEGGGNAYMFGLVEATFPVGTRTVVA